MTKNIKPHFIATVILLPAATGAFAGDVLLKTLMTTRGKVLVSETE